MRKRQGKATKGDKDMQCAKGDKDMQCADVAAAL
jgi:hypothetical protein